MRPPIDSLTADGYDLQFGTNVLGMNTTPMLKLVRLTGFTRTPLLHKAPLADSYRNRQVHGDQDTHSNHFVINSLVRQWC